MKYFSLLVGMVSTLGCSEPKSPEPSEPQPLRDSSTEVDAAHLDAAPSTELDGQVPVPSGQNLDASDGSHSDSGDSGGSGGPSDAGDSGDSGTPRVCSADPSCEVTWRCDSDASANCTGTPLASETCGEESNDLVAALAVAAMDCQQGARSYSVQATGCGYTIIETRRGPGVPQREFYDTDGELVGTWSLTTDVAGGPERCSGSVPVNCIDWEGVNLTGVRNLCSADAGLPEDGGADAQVEAGLFQEAGADAQ